MLQPPEQASRLVGRPRVRAAILGSPVAHSLSPVLHTAAYRALGLSGWHYERHEVDEAGLPGFLAGLGGDWAGLSLTMPLKRVALALADARSDLAVEVGAANTLVRCEAGWRAENTDVHGISAALREAGTTAAGHALILGAGGTARLRSRPCANWASCEPTVLVRDAAEPPSYGLRPSGSASSSTVRGGLARRTAAARRRHHLHPAGRGGGRSSDHRARDRAGRGLRRLADPVRPRRAAEGATIVSGLLTCCCTRPRPRSS